MISINLLINAVLINIVLSYVGKYIILYMPEVFSDNAIVDLLSMNQRKLISSSLLISIIIALAQYQFVNISKNINIKTYL